jgi:hypothetical protein
LPDNFFNDPVQDSDVVDFAGCNDDNTGDASQKIQKHMQFHRCISFPEFGPGKKRKTQIDSRGIQGVKGLSNSTPKELLM